MRKIDSLVLASAATLLAITGAQAADLPVKAKAVQYVKICSLYGAGFYYLPGTETCIKLGGYIQADYNINAGNYDRPGFDQVFLLGTASRDAEYFTTRSRAQFNVDTRTATEYGVVRTYWSSNFEHSTGAAPSTGNLTTDYAFVQFAGFTFGKAASSFQTPWGAYAANNNTSSLLGGFDNATGITQIAYTWQFGNGVSAQFGVEDNRTIDRGQLLNASATQAASSLYTGAWNNAYGGNVSPDFTGNVRIDQAAFTAQLSGAVHNIHATYYGADETSGAPQDAWGYAIAGGLQLKNLPTGAGDKLSLDATYANGALKYIISGTTGTAFDHFSGGSGTFYNSFMSAALIDGVFATGGKIEKTSGWALRGAFTHNWSPNWESSVFGTYSNIDFNSNATALYCARYAVTAGVSGAGVRSCNPDFAIWQIGTRTAWTPVTNLTFSGELIYTGLDTNMVGFLAPTTIPIGFKPAGTYEFKDQGIWSGSLRVRRTW